MSAAASLGETVYVYGLELHKRAGSSDKYYRIFVIGAAVIIHFGRRGSVGQACLHPFQAQAAAISKAQDMGNAKEGSGYRVTREFTQFPYPTADLGEEIRGAGAGDRAAGGTIRLSGHERAVQELTAAFRAAAALAGNVLPGADQ